MSRPCRCEDAVLTAALNTSESLPPDVAAHLDACDACRDLFAIASALQEDRAMAMAEARLPSAGQAWWRAELRARQEAAATATRPITMATGLAVASLLGVLASVAGLLAWWVRDSMAWPMRSVAGSVALMADGMPDGARVVLWGLAALLVVAAPVLAWVAIREE